MIGTITFHWGTNYGGVIQSYALQKAIEKLGVETEIINYRPRRLIILRLIAFLKKCDISGLKKEVNLRKFRKEQLHCSSKQYGNNRDLFKIKDRYSHIIAGSDQIWNYSFTMGAENKPTLSYFLNFAGEHVKKISYAASFGMDNAPSDYVELVKPYIGDFSAVSVREMTGLLICEQLGVESELICDPTVLLERVEYEKLLDGFDRSDDRFIFSYILHGNEDDAKGIINKISSDNNYTVKKDTGEGIERWLENIRDAKVVITNSFHGMMFSLIFNTPFFVIPVKGSTMNDRISTVLTSVGLMDRIIDSSDSIPNNDIDWNYVNSKLEEARNIGIAYIQRNVC